MLVILMATLLVSCSKDSDENNAKGTFSLKQDKIVGYSAKNLDRAIDRFNLRPEESRSDETNSLADIMQDFFEDEEDLLSPEEGKDTKLIAQEVFDKLKSINEGTVSEFAKIFSNVDIKTESIEEFIDIITGSERPLNLLSDFMLLQYLANYRNFLGTVQSTTLPYKKITDYYTARIHTYENSGRYKSESIISFLYLIVQFNSKHIPTDLAKELSLVMNNIEVDSNSPENVMKTLESVVDFQAKILAENIAFDFRYSKRFLRSLLSYIENRVSLEGEPSVLLSQIDDAMKLIRVNNIDVSTHEYYDILTREYFHLSKLTESTAIIKSNLKNIDQFNGRLKIALQRKNLLDSNSKKISFQCDIPIDETVLENTERFRKHYDFIECAKTKLITTQNAKQKILLYEKMRQSLFYLLTQLELLDSETLYQEITLKKEQENIYDSLYYLNNEIATEEIDSVVFDFSLYNGKKVPAGIYYSNKDIIIEGENIIFDPLTIILAPQKKVSFSKKNTVSAKNIWIDVNGLTPSKSESFNYGAYYSRLSWPTRVKTGSYYSLRINNYNKIVRPPKQTSGRQGFSAGEIDVSNIKTSGSSVLTAVGGRGGLGADSTKSARAPYTINYKTCKIHTEETMCPHWGRGMECERRIIETEICKNKSLRVTAPRINKGNAGKGGSQGLIKTSEQNRSNTMSIISEKGLKGL